LPPGVKEFFRIDIPGDPFSLIIPDRIVLQTFAHITSILYLHTLITATNERKVPPIHRPSPARGVAAPSHSVTPRPSWPIRAKRVAFRRERVTIGTVGWIDPSWPSREP